MNEIEELGHVKGLNDPSYPLYSMLLLRRRVLHNSVDHQRERVRGFAAKTVHICLEVNLQILFVG